MSKFVRIQSNETIHVTCGLQNKDVTNADAHVPDRLKVSATWPKATVLIEKGAHMYPSEIAEWATVKALAKDKVLTIGEFTDVCDEDGVEQKKTELKATLEEIKQESTSNKRGRKTTLNEIAEE